MKETRRQFVRSVAASATLAAAGSSIAGATGSAAEDVSVHEDVSVSEDFGTLDTEWTVGADLSTTAGEEYWDVSLVEYADADDRAVEFVADGRAATGMTWVYTPVDIDPGTAYRGTATVRMWSPGTDDRDLSKVHVCMAPEAPTSAADFPTGQDAWRYQGERGGMERSLWTDAGWTDYTCRWESPELDTDQLYVAVGVSTETGDWLQEYADRGGEVALSVDARTEPGEGTNARGVLGPDTDEEVVVLAHHDAHDIAEGALDNGCGVATLVAAARVLDDLALDATVRLATVGAEEVGLQGASALADDLDPESIRAVVNLDGAGRYRTLRAFLHGTDAFADVLDAVGDDTGHPVEVRKTVHPYSDHWPFLRAGVPVLQLHSVTPERGRGWGHTHADTRDKADSRNLREHGMLAALVVRELAREDAGFPRPDEDVLRDRLDDDGMRPGMEAAGVWPPDWE